MFLSASLGFILWHTSRELITQTRASVALGEVVVQTDQDGRRRVVQVPKVPSPP